jgi:hypothetical protein
MKRFWMGLALAAGSITLAQADTLRDDTLRLLAEHTSAARDPGKTRVAVRASAKHALADISENAILRANDPAQFDEFGNAVATDGNTVVIGAHGNDEVAPDVDTDPLPPNDGAVYVYVRNSETWSLQQRIIPADLSRYDAFGSAVAIKGDTLVIGSPQYDVGVSEDNTGAVYVYTRSAGVWTFQTKLAAADLTADSRFGAAVAIDAGTIVATAPRVDIDGVLNVGAAYVFTGSGASWAQQARLRYQSGVADDALGNDVDLEGDVVVVGAQFADDGALLDTGAAYVFTRSAGVWSAAVRLESPAQAEDGRFGRAVTAGSDGTIAVSDHLRSSGEGAVVLYAGSGVTWTPQQTIGASDGAALDFFGHALSLRGDVLLVGAYNANLGSNIDRGAAYRFERVLGTWSEVDKYFASDNALNDRVAFDVDLGSANAVLGAPYEASGSNNLQRAGSAYLFHLGTPTTTIQILNPIPTTFGGLLGLSAQVSGGTPTGTVEFRNGAIVLASAPVNGSGVAATTITPNAASYSVVAHYLGDAVHLPSNSAATAFTVAKADTTLALASDVASPGTYGQNVTFTATVDAALGMPAGASPVTGTVEFRDDATLLATVPLAGGVATHTTNALLHNNGTAHPITATFVANTNYNGSVGTTINHVVNKASPTLNLLSNPNPSLLGQDVLVTATLSGGLAPSGTVTLLDDGVPFAAPTLASGIATQNTDAFALGVNSLTAFYGGDANHNSALTAGPYAHEVLPSADVSVTKSNGTDFVQSGQETVYTIVVTNPAGGADVDGLLLDDILNPAYFDVGSADWSCDQPSMCTPSSGTGDINALSLDLAANTSVTITLTVPVLVTAESGVSNTVTLTMPNTVADPNEANNAATDSDGSGLFGDGFEDSVLPN